MPKAKKGIAARLAAVAGAVPEAPKRTEENDKEIGKLLQSTSPHTMEKVALVGDAFSVFDPSNKNMIDVREVGCLVRALGMSPTEEDLKEIVVMVEDSETPGYVKYDRFVPYVAKLLLDGNPYPGPSDDDLRKAFKVLDLERIGNFDIPRMREIMQKEGEPFTSDEFDDMMRFGLNPDDQKFYWAAYLDKAGVKNSEAPAKGRKSRNRAANVTK